VGGCVGEEERRERKHECVCQQRQAAAPEELHAKAKRVVDEKSSIVRRSACWAAEVMLCSGECRAKPD
jgi:hypothetical protein